MKKNVISIFVMILFVSLSVITPVFANYDSLKGDSEHFNVHDIGRLEYYGEKSSVDPVLGLETITVTNGIEILGSFKINTESFEAEFYDPRNDINYVLVGNIKEKYENPLAYIYEGIDKNNNSIKFQAYIFEPETSNSNYSVLINTNHYNLNDAQQIDTKSYTFDGRGSKITSYINKISTEPNDKVTITDHGPYYHQIYRQDKFGIKTQVVGPSKLIKGGSGDYVFRNTTDVMNIIRDLPDKDRYQRGRILDWNVKIYSKSSDPLSLSTVQPHSGESKKQINIPLYLGQKIGLITVPITLSTVSVMNPNNYTLDYKFGWSHVLDLGDGYLDERSFDDDSCRDCKGFGVRFEIKHEASSKDGYFWPNFDASFKYSLSFFNPHFFDYIKVFDVETSSSFPVLVQN